MHSGAEIRWVSRPARSPPCFYEWRGCAGLEPGGQGALPGALGAGSGASCPRPGAPKPRDRLASRLNKTALLCPLPVQRLECKTRR